MVNMVEKLRMAGKLEEFVAKFNQSFQAFSAQCCTITTHSRYLMIAQYEERRWKGVVMVPEDANGEGWISIFQVFQAVIDSFVASDNVNRRTNKKLKIKN